LLQKILRCDHVFLEQRRGGIVYCLI
jgi:hypothetical protein